MYFGTLLRQKRKEMGLTQEQIAAKTGVPQRRISYVERSIRYHQHFLWIGKIIKAMGLSMDKFYEELTGEKF